MNAVQHRQSMVRVGSHKVIRAWRWRGAGGLLLAAAMMLTGCDANKKDGVSRLTPRSVPFLTGVPVPVGFTLQDRMTDAYESGGIRFARQEYLGSADVTTVREFYREQMPLLGWTEISSQDIKGRAMLRFEDKKEECTVMIDPSGWLNRSNIQVVIKPFNRNPSEPPPRRPMP